MKKIFTTAITVSMLVPTVSSLATTTGPVTGNDQLNYESNLNIEGILFSKDNTAPEGQISVTLPTSVIFAINADGTVITPTDLSIVNRSSCGIDVTISKFNDSTPTDGAGITVVEESGLTNKDRSYVSLTLLPQGNTNNQVILKSSGFTSTKLATIGTGATTNLTLIGKAGQEEDSEATEKGIKDSFTLTFNIAKAKDEINSSTTTVTH